MSTRIRDNSHSIFLVFSLALVVAAAIAVRAGADATGDVIQNFEDIPCRSNINCNHAQGPCSQGGPCNGCTASLTQKSCTSPEHEGSNCVMLTDQDGCGEKVSGICDAQSVCQGEGNGQNCARTWCNDNQPTP